MRRKYLIELKTKRLRLLCLDINQMEMLKDSIWRFEDEMGLVHSKSVDCGDELTLDFYHAYLYHKENYMDYNLLWLKTWQFINIKDNKICGGACFKGAPNDDGEVEIGYGIDDDYQRKGYATEAIEELVRWAHTQENVRWVIAETEKDNIPSQKVLIKIGMERYRENNENYYWRL